MPKFRVIVNETNTVVYEIEANDEDHASARSGLRQALQEAGPGQFFSEDAE